MEVDRFYNSVISCRFSRSIIMEAELQAARAQLAQATQERDAANRERDAAHQERDAADRERLSQKERMN